VDKKRSCAYCDGTKELTNEHVIPECYLKTLGPTISIVKTPTEDQAIPNAQEIGDVCAVCNNGPLSLLDTYLASLSQQHFSKIVHPGDRIRFSYDFDQLLRLVLKLGYNVARTRGWPLAVFREARQYILGKEKCPPGAYSGDVNGRFQRDVNGHSGHVNKVGAQRRWDYNHARHLRD